MQEEPIRLIGGTASPYTQKMLALLRYRRIPYAITWGQPKELCEAQGIAPPKPALMPTFLLEEGGSIKARCDSTPIIRQLDVAFTERAVIPYDPALAFIDYLLEDFADEWCTKYMFHYRWHGETDASNAATLLPLGFDVSMESDSLQTLQKLIGERQRGRLPVVGSNDKTAPIIEASFDRFIGALDAQLAVQPFMLGYRPSACDFALYGQLSQLVGFDPTPRALIHGRSPRTVAWVDHLADQSGREPQAHHWLSLAALPEALRGLLCEIGRVYTPTQLANARAVVAGEPSWKTVVDGREWEQPTFAYQAKCLSWTRERYHALDADSRAAVDALLVDTGISAMLSEPV